MRLLSLFATLALSLPALGAPKHWLWERGFPQGNSLNAIAVTRSGGAFVAAAVGDFGSIVTYEGSSGWTMRTSGTQVNLKGVAMPSAATLYAVGSTATVLKSADGGATWAALACKGCADLLTVAFLSDQVGVIAGNGGIFYTTDGATFSKATNSVSSLVKVAFSQATGSKVVFGLAKDGTLYKSTDGGASWALSLASFDALATSYGLSALNDLQVFVGADKNRILTNGTGGTAWATMSGTATTNTYDFVDVSVTAATVGYAIGRISPVSTPPNVQLKLFSYSGSGWAEVNIGAQKTDVWAQALASSGQTLFIAGQGGMLFRSSNGGATLYNDGNATGQRYFDVAPVDATHQIAAGAEGAISVGASSIWNEYYCGAGNFQSVAAGATVSIAVADDGTICGASNGALQTWTARAVPSPLVRQRAAAFLGGQTFASGGDDGAVWLSTNNAVSFSSVDVDTTSTQGIATLSVRPSTTPELWVGTGPVGTAVKLYRTTTPGTANYTDASSTLVPAPSSLNPPGTTVRDINWLDASTGFLMVSASNGCGAGAGYVYRTTNGGEVWNRVVSLPVCSTCFGWKDVYAINANHLWVQGELCFGQVAFDGASWTFTSEAVPTPFNLLGLGGAKNGELWMVGNFGAVLHSHCGGTDTSTCVPDTNSCTDDVCVPATGACAAVPNTANACDDHDPCTLGDHCGADGSCQHTPKSCDDGNACTDDVCQSTDGGCRSSVVAGRNCTDGDLCTTQDACQADGTCVGTPVSCAPSTECTVNACDRLTGQCTATNRDTTTLCSDGLACTSDERCDGAGTCRGTDTCVAPQCQVASCHTDGTCHTTPVTGVVRCDDGDPCTTNDLCDQGTCKGVGRCVDGGAGGGAGSDGGAMEADAGPAQPVFHPGCGCSSDGGGALGALVLALALLRRARPG